MDQWVVASVVLAGLAVGAPLLTRSFRKTSGAKVGEQRARQEAVIQELDGLLAPLLEAAHRGEPVKVGPGTPFHEPYLVLRRRIQQEFRSLTGIRFDREIGYALLRPGPIELPNKLAGQVAEAKAVLREEMAA